MANAILPIDAKKIIKTHRPTNEEKRNVGKWFLDETIEIDFGDSVGRPSKNILLQREYLTKFLENGWTVDAVVYSNSDGRWSTRGVETTTGLDRVVSFPDARWLALPSDNKVDSISVSSNDNNKKTVTETDANAYWEVRQKVRLKRRRMQPEIVLQNMIDSYTDSYNEGRGIESSRFDELMTLLSIVLKKNEDEGNRLIGNVIEKSGPEKFLDSLYSSTWSSFRAASSSVGDLTAAAIADVNRNFNAIVAKARSDMVANGTFNGTVWPTVLEGIERQRADALAKARADASKAESDTFASLGAARASAASAFLAAKNAIEQAKDNKIVTAVEMRNKVIGWIVDYVSTRREDYPNLQAISSIAERLGFSVGSAGNVL